jgi:hypothetical protein
MAVNSKITVQKGKLVTGVIVGLIVLIMFGQIFMVHALAVDSDGDGISDATEWDLAVRYLPNLQFKVGEEFFPVEISYHLNNSVLKLRGVEAVTTVDQHPTIASISTKRGSYFLANKFGDLSAIAADYESKRSTLGYTVYCRVTKDSTLTAFTVVQYWFFYAYNNAPLNDHEGDWEMIELVLEDTAQAPTWVAYSQHLKGQRASWGDVEKVDSTHPVVYVARGSHANYFRPYQGRLGLENDEVGADGLNLKPGDVKPILLGEMGASYHNSSQDWLTYGGRWGNWANLADSEVGFAGPFGPGHTDNSDKWFNPVLWGQGVPEANSTLFTFSWIAANFLLIFIVITILLSIWKIWKIVKLRKTGGLRLPALLKTKASIGVVLGVVALGLTFAGMLLPWYMVKANVQTSLISTHGEAELLVMDGQRGLIVNFLVGNSDPSPLFSLQIPFGILLLVGIVFGVLDIVGMKTAKDLGNKYLRGGLFFLILFIVLVLLIFEMTSIIQSLATSFGLSLPPEATQMAQAVAQQPLQGTQTTAVGSYGSVALSWGLGLGAYMLLAAAIVRLVAAIVLRGVKEAKPRTAATQTPPPPPL